MPNPRTPGYTKSFKLSRPAASELGLLEQETKPNSEGEPEKDPDPPAGIAVTSKLTVRVLSRGDQPSARGTERRWSWS